MSQTAGNKGARDTGRIFRAQCQHLAALVFEGVHFLGHDVGRVAQSSGKYFRALKNGGFDFIKTVAAGYCAHCVDYLAMTQAFFH